MSRASNIISIAAAVILLSIQLLFQACGGEGAKHAPNVSGIDVKIELQRFEQDLFALDTNKLESELGVLARKYPDFLPFFLTEIAHDQTRPDESPLEAISGFVESPQLRRLNDSCQAAFPDLNRLHRDLTELMKYYRYYFPQKPVPRFVTAVTEFIGDAYVVNDTLVMVGLDFFLGETFTGYNPEIFPYYLRRQFQPDYMTTKVALALSANIAGPPPGERILDYMINNGKILYLMDCLLPTVPDSMKMGYTREQIEGCIANEQEVWARLLALQVLYQTVNAKNQKIVMPSPSTDIVFQESPGEIGNWVGWQIVKAYMRRFPDTSLEKMLNLRDSQQFLEQAKYKPKRVE